jgi:glycosyltransferase involved in cell wall biosynthesis
MSKSCLSVVIPCFNEQKTIEKLLNQVLAQDLVQEVIIIDDFSTDNSSKIILGFNDQRIKYFRNSKNLGKGASVSKAFGVCSAEFVLIQDADLEYSPTEYPRLLKPLLDGEADVVFGSRFLTYDMRRVLYYWHRLGNHFLTTLSNIFTNLDLTDMETCYKIMKRDIAQKLNIQERRFGIEPEITSKLAIMGAVIYEVPISYRGRTYAEGKKITWKDGFRAIVCIVKYNSPRFKRKFRLYVKSK